MGNTAFSKKGSTPLLVTKLTFILANDLQMPFLS
jgi:hypothetical protein